MEVRELSPRWRATTTDQRRAHMLMMGAAKRAKARERRINRLLDEIGSGPMTEVQRERLLALLGSEQQ